MRIVWVFVVAACATTPDPIASPPASAAPAHWIYRVYGSGIESNHEGVTTWVLDERTHSADVTEQVRRGRAGVPWTSRPPTHYTLAVTHGSALELALTAADGTETHYTCTPQQLDVAPATAMRASEGGESGWKLGHWTVPTQKLSVDVCHAEGATDLLLADEPLEHVVADDGCCGDEPSLRFVPADRSIVAPRDPSFPAEP